ncbi:hypothetical protein L1987_55017 [Smallanthus sonchifolius]|uniref:Uncharacterized protein n=1 Tax=Smallanthus sonchifolius TaxID=185202 RepID=A0ACB9E8V3_9ASTR|nr:hypothetical protein L1987_55017 [Smallanthus sonchifolius]
MGSQSVDSVSPAGETVIVVINGNKGKGSLDALKWAIKYLVGPKDTVVVLGVLPEIGKRSNPSCIPFHLGIGSSGIYIKLEFSNSEMTPSQLQREIERKKREYQKFLEPYYHHCKKREVKLDIRLAVGLESKNVTIEEAQKHDPRWIVLDGYFKKDKEYIHKHVNCHVALLKTKGVATLIPSKITSPESAEWQSVCRKIDNHALTTVDFVDEPHSPKQAPTSPCSYPLSWRTWLQRDFTIEEVEEITNGFNNVILKDHHRIIYGGVFGESQVVVMCFPADDQAFFLLKITSRICHRNILSFIGYCCIDDSVFILLDCPQASLEACLLCKSFSVDLNWLGDKAARNLVWEARWAIALDIGTGIQYLHEEFVDGSIVNMPITSSNVGLAGSSCATFISLMVISKLCICDTTIKQLKFDDDPMSKLPSVKCADTDINEHLRADVKDYGVFLLELISGQSTRLFEKDGQCLVDWALPLLEKNLLSPLLDPRLTEPNDPQVAHMARAALACLKNDLSHYLKISQVLAIVRGDQ